MSYATSNPPALMGIGPLTGAGKWWTYRSTDVATDVDASGYFTNGEALGMQVGDVVVVTDTDTSTTVTLHRVTAISGGAATVSTTGLTIT